MSTKRLSRTIIEGGRRTSYKEERILSLRKARRLSKSILQNYTNHLLNLDYDSSEDSLDLFFPEREKSSFYPGEKFHDKLGPVNRWMDKYVNQNWNDIYSKMRKEFDYRTTPGRHILFDHILYRVWQSPDQSHRSFKYHDYYVDQEGILRNADQSWKGHRYTNPLYYTEPEQDRKEKKLIPKWLGVRKIGLVGNKYFWYVPVSKIPEGIYFSWDFKNVLPSFRYYLITPRFGWIYWYQGIGGPELRYFDCTYRQDKPLTKDEVQFLLSLSPKNRKLILDQAPIPERIRLQHFKNYFRSHYNI